MIKIDQDALVQRFTNYVRIDTQSDPDSTTHPTTEKQKDLSVILAKELKDMGLAQVETDEFGYVYATIPSNTDKNVPAICFCSHVDTSSDCSGTNVKPLYHKNYDGKDIVLPDDPTQILRPSDFPYLKEHIGSDLITASGLTLLGADDKSGVAIIMQAADHLIKNPSIKHGDIKIVFTPDEEVGQGTAKIDMKKVGAPFGYTLDGGSLGALEDETFNADAATIIVTGVSIHPGYAKGKLVNAIKIVSQIVDALPKDEWSPETTDKKQGFVHPVDIRGGAEKASIQFIVRDFEESGLTHHHDRLKKIAEKITANYPGAILEYQTKKQYRNMKQVLDQHPQIIAYASEAIERAGLKVNLHSIRGGTDGSNLTFLGMPCPNIFTGMQNFHGKLEWIGVRDMVKATETVIHLAAIWEEKS